MAAHVVRVLAVLRQRVGEGRPHARLRQRARVLLFQHVLLLAQFTEPGVLQRLTRCYSVIRIVHEQFLNEILYLGARVRNQFDYASALDRREVELHMRRILLEVVEEALVGRAQNVVNLVHLVDLIVAGEEREQRDNLEEDAANAPQVHLVTVIAVREEALGSTIPTSRNVLRVWLFRIDAAAGAEIGQLHVVLHEQNVLGLDISMENTIPVHMIDRFEQLIHVIFDPVLG